MNPHDVVTKLAHLHEEVEAAKLAVLRLITRHSVESDRLEALHERERVRLAGQHAEELQSALDCLRMAQLHLGDAQQSLRIFSLRNGSTDTDEVDLWQ